jgi:hypothetical protein
LECFAGGTVGKICEDSYVLFTEVEGHFLGGESLGESSCKRVALDRCIFAEPVELVVHDFAVVGVAVFECDLSLHWGLGC